MSADEVSSRPETANKRPFKSSGRVAAMTRLNEEGLGGMGGRRPTHGRKALVRS